MWVVFGLTEWGSNPQSITHEVSTLYTTDVVQKLNFCDNSPMINVTHIDEHDWIKFLHLYPSIIVDCWEITWS
jgi:hypothetical protein